MFDDMTYESDHYAETFISQRIPYKPTVAEIEKAMLSHPAVEDVYVMQLPNEMKDEQFFAFVKLKEGISHSSELKWQIGWHAVAEIGTLIEFKSIVIIDSPLDLMATFNVITKIDSKEPNSGKSHIFRNTVSIKGIETALKSNPWVSDALVIEIPEEDDSPSITAYVTLKSCPKEPEEVKWELAWLLAGEMNSEVKFDDIVIIDAITDMEVCMNGIKQSEDAKGTFIQPFFWW